MTRKEFFEKLKEETELKLWEYEYEKRYQERWMLLDTKKDTIVNGQKIPVADYISILQKDINQIVSRIKLIEDILEELNKK